MRLAPAFGHIKYDQNLILPNPVFTPETQEKVRMYFKLAEIAKKKVLWSSIGLLAISGTFFAMVWTSGSVIYHCFQKSQSDPSIYTEINIQACIAANGDKVYSSWNFLNGSTFAYLSVYNFIYVLTFYFSTRITVETSVKLLAYGVKTTCYSVYGSVYYIIGVLVGFLLHDTLHQNLTPIDPNSATTLYFWGYKNYPATFLDISVRFAQNIGLLLGLIKFMLSSIKDPFEIFCSFSDIITVGSNQLDFQIPIIKFTTEVLPIYTTNYQRINERKKKEKKEKKKETENLQQEEDYLFQQTLTVFEEQGLLFPCDEEQTKSNFCDNLKRYIGLRSEGVEKKCRYLISKKDKINNEEKKLLKQMLKKLITNIYTKKSPLLLLFSMVFISTVLGAELPVQKRLLSLTTWSWIYDLPNLTLVCHNIFVFAMIFLLEFAWAIVLCILSLAASCFEAYLSVICMLQIINSQENYYVIAPYIVMVLAIIQVIMHLKMLFIILLIQRGKKLLSEGDLDKSVELTLPVNSEAF